MRAYRRLHKLILVGNFYFLITNLQLYTKGPPDLGQYKGRVRQTERACGIEKFILRN